MEECQFKFDKGKTVKQSLPEIETQKITGLTLNLIQITSLNFANC